MRQQPDHLILQAEIPEGWLVDEPKEIPDPDAVKPEEWDDEEDGDWIPPMVRNPKCDEAPGCGTWTKYVYFMQCFIPFLTKLPPGL